MNTARMGEGNAGVSQSSAQVAGGYTGTPTTGRDYTEQYNGTAWTEVNNLNTARFYFAGCGTTTAALVTGGDIPGAPTTGNTEKWNGLNYKNGFFFLDENARLLADEIASELFI